VPPCPYDLTWNWTAPLRWEPIYKYNRLSYTADNIPLLNHAEMLMVVNIFLCLLLIIKSLLSNKLTLIESCLVPKCLILRIHSEAKWPEPNSRSKTTDKEQWFTRSTLVAQIVPLLHNCIAWRFIPDMSKEFLWEEIRSFQVARKLMQHKQLQWQLKVTNAAKSCSYEFGQVYSHEKIIGSSR
jgi:hypothetical protein